MPKLHTHVLPQNQVITPKNITSQKISTQYHQPLNPTIKITNTLKLTLPQISFLLPFSHTPLFSSLQNICPLFLLSLHNPYNVQFIIDSQPNNILFKKNSMKYIYVMVPLAQIQQHADIVSEVEGLLKMSKHCFEVKEIEENFLIVDVKDFELGFLEIEQIVKQCMNLQQKVELYEEIVKNYKFEDSSKQQPNEATNIESLVRKAKKAKQLKEENKKLKKLLQLQLQNTEKVREETQKTMRTLKEQFDALVEEMNGRETKENTIKNERKEHGHKEKEKRNIKRQLNF